MKTAVVAGATGLVGHHLLARMLASPRYERILALTRTPLAVQHPRLRHVITDFHDLDGALAGVKPDDVFCCLGTTMAKAGSRKKFYEVDFEYPFTLARITRGLGAAKFLLVSALGADTHSSIYYNKVKGEAEAAIRTLDFECLHIFRPSLLLGHRREKRPGEEVAKAIFRIFGFMVPAKYRPVPAEKVAEAMLTSAAQSVTGVFVHESRDILAQARYDIPVKQP